MFEEKTPEGIKNSILKSLPSWSTQSGSYANTLVAAAAYEIWQCYITLDSLLPMFYVDETSGEYIDLIANTFGLERKEGALAYVSLSLIASRELSIPAGTGFSTSSGLVFYTERDLHIETPETPFEVAAAAGRVGAAYNVSAGSIVSPVHVISGLNSVTNLQAAYGGADKERDEALVTRLYSRLRKPPTSGNIYHYEQWALEVNGVGFVKVSPLWDGPGTVRLLLASPQGLSVSEETVAAAVEHIEGERPIGAAVTVISAVEKALNISAIISLDGSKSMQEIENAFRKLLTDFLQELIFKASIISRNKIAFLLLSVPGVSDYSGLTINSSEDNVTLLDAEIAIPGTITIEEG